MSTLHLNREPVDHSVILEDWYDELADESLDPANIVLIVLVTGGVA